MPRVYRLTRARHRATPFSGAGGHVSDGRWHRIGHDVLYASPSVGAAYLEVLANTDADLVRGLTLVYVVLELADEDVLPVERLVPGGVVPLAWLAPDTYAPDAQALGTAWLRGATSVALGVPSVASPGDRNVVLNPRHPRFERLRREGPFDYVPDPRVVGRFGAPP